MKKLELPPEVVIGEITVRDGFQHEENFIPTRAKLWCLEELILAGFKKLEVTNFGHPRAMPQFQDAEELFNALYQSSRVKDLLDQVELTAITINKRAVERAIEAKKRGAGPHRILQMVSTSEPHQLRNSGMNHQQYWQLTEECIKDAHRAGMKVNGTVSTIWGCPLTGPTRLEEAVEFTRRYLELGADDIEHADHDGSATPDQVYRYFSMIMDHFPDPSLHVAHFHVTRGWGLANVLAAMQAGINRFESTMGGIGGQPANFFDGAPVPGTGSYYYQDPNIVGLVCTEDLVVMLEEMGIDTGLDLNRVLEIGSMVERICGRRLRSEALRTGPIPDEPTGF